MSQLLATTGIVDVITSVLGGLLYPLFSIIFGAISAVQGIFEAFAGIGTSRYNTPGISIRDTIYGGTDARGNVLGGGEKEQGLVYYLMQQEIVQSLLMSIMTLALILVIVFTVMAFIKNAYAAKPKGWKEIVGSSLKGLANFIFLPVCCLLGVWLGNILLQAINGATSYGQGTDMSRKLFIASAYNANRVRISPNMKVERAKAYAVQAYVDGYTYSKLNIDINGDSGGEDDDFLIFEKMTEEEAKRIIDNGAKGITSDEELKEYYARVIDQVFAQTSIDIWTGNTVVNYYSLFNINYLILVVAGGFMLYVLGSLAFAMVRRMFLILVLFVVSPALCAMYPLDDGKAVGTWKSKFLEQVLSAYGAVAGMNIFFSLLPYIENIQVVTYFGMGFGIDEILQLFILVCGLFVVKEFIQLISTFVGGENAYTSGASLMKSAASKVTKPVGTAVGRVGGALIRAGAAKKAGGSWGDSIRKSLKTDATDLGNSALKWLSGGAIDVKGSIDNAKKAAKEGKAEGEREVAISQFERQFSVAYDALNADNTGARDKFNQAAEDYKNNKTEGNRVAMEKAGAELEAAQREYQRVLSSFSEDVQGAAIEKMAKSEHKSVEEKKREMEEARRYDLEAVAARTSRAKVERLDENITGVAASANATAGAADAETKKLIGDRNVLLRLAGSSLFSSSDQDQNFRDLMQMMRNGIHVDVDSLASTEDKVAAAAFNKEIDKQQSMRDQADSAAKTFGETFEQYASRLKDGDGKVNGVELTPENLEKLKDAIMSGNFSDQALRDVSKAIEADTKYQESYIKKELASIEQIRKIIEDMHKNK